MISTSPKDPLRSTLSRWLLGPGTTFRNAHRNWLYLGYLAAILAMLGLAALKP